MNQELETVENVFCIPEEKSAIRDDWNDVIMNFTIDKDSFTFDMGDTAIIARGDNLKRLIRVMKASVRFYQKEGVTN